MQYGHGGFYAAIKATYLPGHPNSEFLEEMQLGEQPLRLDMLIIRNRDEYTDPIGGFFSDYNVIEYKSVGESPDLIAFDRMQVYALEYRVRNEVPRGSLTASMFRHARPSKLFEELKAVGCVIQRRYPGVYTVTGSLIIPAQVIVTRELPKGEYTALKIIHKGAAREDVLEFLNLYGGQQELVGFVSDILRQSAVKNAELFEKMKQEDTDVKDAIEYIFREEFKAERQAGETAGKIQTLIDLVQKHYISEAIAAEELGMTIAEFEQYLKGKTA